MFIFNFEIKLIDQGSGKGSLLWRMPLAVWP